MNGQSCNFCGGKFGDTYKLERHKRSAKYCLEIQNSEKDKTLCSLCKKKFYTERDLKAHKCVLHQDDLNGIISGLLEKINNLEARTVVLESSVKETKQPGFEVLKQLDESFIKSTIDKFTIEHTNKGVSGYALFALEYVFKDRLILVDKDRKKFAYKTETGEKRIDNGLSYLSTVFFSVINQKNKELILSQKKQLPDNDSDEEECIINQWHTYKKYIFLVQEASVGVKDNFVKDFVDIISDHF